MTIGKHCQICGTKKRPGEVVAEAHGIVVTAPCLMTKVFGDPPAPPESVREMAGYCAVCGAEQQKPLAGNCPSCGSPLIAESAQKELAAAGVPASRGSRLAAFMIDLALVGVISAAAIYGVGLLEGAIGSVVKDSGADEVEDTNIFTVMKYASVLVSFVLYHAVFTSLTGMTVGKMICGIRVVMKNGSKRVDFTRALLRSALYLFTIYVVPIGLLPLIFQEPPGRWPELIEQDAMFHNSLTDTVVIRPGP